MGWKDVGMSAGGADFLKIEAGKSVKVHIIGPLDEDGKADPKSFFQYYNQDVQRGLVVPAGHKDASIKIRAQHAFLVWSFEDAAVKVWAMGNRLAKVLQGTAEAYDGSFDEIDLVVKRTGQGKDTTYVPTPKPTEFDPSLIEGVELPNLDELFAEASVEDIENLKQGIVPTREDAPEEPAADAGEASGGEETPADDAPTETDEERELREFKEQQAAKRAAAAKGTAKPAPAAGKPAAGKPAPAADERMTLVKNITHLFAKNAKYKTPAARLAVIKTIAKGKTTLSQLSVPELKALEKKVK